MNKEISEALKEAIKNGGVQVNMDCTDVCFNKIVMEKKNDENRMPASMNREMGIDLYNLLTQSSVEFINRSLSLDAFLYWFGVIDKRPKDLQPIEWQQTKQQARILMKGIYAQALENKSILMKDIEERIQYCFIYKDKPLKLANNSEEYSEGASILEDFFRG